MAASSCPSHHTTLAPPPSCCCCVRRLRSASSTATRAASSDSTPCSEPTLPTTPPHPTTSKPTRRQAASQPAMGRAGCPLLLPEVDGGIDGTEVLVTEPHATNTRRRLLAGPLGRGVESCRQVGGVHGGQQQRQQSRGQRGGGAGGGGREEEREGEREEAGRHRLLLGGVQVGEQRAGRGGRQAPGARGRGGRQGGHEPQGVHHSSSSTRRSRRGGHGGCMGRGERGGAVRRTGPTDGWMDGRHAGRRRKGLWSSLAHTDHRLTDLRPPPPLRRGCWPGSRRGGAAGGPWRWSWWGGWGADRWW